jgi:hypothetical protein
MIFVSFSMHSQFVEEYLILNQIDAFQQEIFIMGS